MSEPTVRPRVAVVDLTSSLGLHALRTLLPGAAAAGPWLGLPLAGLPGGLQLDWHRPEQAADLQVGSEPPLGLYVFVGPGSVARLSAVLPLLTGTPALELVFLLAPNAVIEAHHLRQPARLAAVAAPPVLLQLPGSDAQALWMILLEQISSLMRRDDAARQLPLCTTSGDDMSSNLKQSMEQAMTIEGAVAVALVDHRSGMCLAQAGGGMNLELAAAGNSEVVRAKLRTIESLGLRNTIEDILITLQHQYHLIRLIPANPGLFLYLALDRQRGNLALARYKLTDIERGLKV